MKAAEIKKGITLALTSPTIATNVASPLLCTKITPCSFAHTPNTCYHLKPPACPRIPGFP